MLCNLDLELRRKKQKPIIAIMTAIECSEKTARNKLNGVTSFTVNEAIKIIDAYFREDNISLKVLFARERTSA